MLAFEQLQSFVLVLIAICALISAISLAVSAITKYWRFAHQQSDDNTDKLNEHDTFLASDKRRIESLEQRQDETDRMNRLQLKALFTLLGHEIDGNHTEQLKAVRDEINTYLIEK